MAIDKIVDMVAVWDCLVATIWPVHVQGIMPVANMPASAGSRILVVHIESMFLNNTG